MDPGTSNRELRVQVIEKYFRCVVEGRLDDLPVTEDYGSESPLSGPLEAPKAFDYLGAISREIKDIRVLRHVVENSFAATEFEEVLARGVLPAVALFEFEGDRIRYVRVYFDSAAPPAR